ncbi:hypothetical protein [Anthocerotibacter panamensis]|uniref:hypothetical protein n=1 Tax=Anthocerotibacter panamensis TaxID=2857077 RepID=UPI001C407D48|nr:hypothetical protein [Anthocerotibacter panamensis]
MTGKLFGSLPGIDPLSFQDAVFQGDTLVVDLKGRNLAQVNAVRVRPTKGITCTLGDPLERKGQVVQTADTLTVTVQVDRKTPPGEKYLWVQSPAGDSNPIMFIVMM